MTQTKPRKQRVDFTVEQKLDYAKLMVNESYSNKQVMEISRWRFGNCWECEAFP